MALQAGQRVRLKFSTHHRETGKDEGGHPVFTADPHCGTVTGHRARGEFRVTFDSSPDRKKGTPRPRFWYLPDQVSGFEMIGEIK